MVWTMVLVAASETMKPAPMTGRMRSESQRARESPKPTSPAPNTVVATAIARPRPSTDAREAR